MPKKSHCSAPDQAFLLRCIQAVNPDVKKALVRYLEVEGAVVDGVNVAVERVSCKSLKHKVFFSFVI